jgi:hypothetical protein
MIGGRVARGANAPDAVDKVDLRSAYERGRRDERAARKRHPVLMTLTFAAAAIGVVLLVLAAVHGSFGVAGGLVDQQLSTAADQAGPAARQAADNAGQRLHDAAQSAKSNTPS